MTRTIKMAPLPSPPEAYDVGFMNRFARTLEQLFFQLTTPGYETIQKLSLTDLPTSPFNLPTGYVWRDGDVLKVVLAGTGGLNGEGASGSVGTITVITS